MEFVLGSRADFDKYIKWADIKFVRAAYLVQLHEQGEDRGGVATETRGS